METKAPFKVGDRVTLVQEYYGIPEGTTCVISKVRSAYAQAEGESFLFCVEDHPLDKLFYEKRFKAYVEPEPIEVVIPKDVPATITATVTDEDGNLYEHHVYNRHAEGEQQSEGFFWNKVTSWGGASFYDGYLITLTLWINGTQRQEIVIKRGV